MVDHAGKATTARITCVELAEHSAATVVIDLTLASCCQHPVDAD